MHNPNGFPLLKKIALSLLLCLMMLQAAYCAPWKSIGPGIEYQDLYPGYLTPWAHIHAFKIDSAKYRLQLAMARNLALPNASVNRLARSNGAAMAFNGGFFDKRYRPLGLRVSAGKVLNPSKKISWWGVFYTRGTRAFIAAPRRIPSRRQLDFALQSGPRLIINGRIPSLKPGKAQRTAMGIDKQGNLIVLVTDNVALSTAELAELMHHAPLSCQNALNLDGGSSTQLLVNLPDFKLNVHGFSNVSDAVLLIPR